ncbi:peptidoglycan/LPS O-acetylase OafA/YrhL [Comamonas sp. BIGb0152]|uniref:acyltransferase family protein n=1 Tax=Comamonas sp. BIGb0152 TaxID=2940601 RepID=UPI0021685E88|nr:acyltransferase family protein [Comamonas sp. BIGb0152]MCS4292987.1 peptidoglycan/LPS O-acetylase OafA/YrhL [Comamonas sp. BIGb0152]
MQKSSASYIPAVDGLRAVAVLAVIVFHANFLDLLPGGFTGVDMFFVISGYVISQSLSTRSEWRFGKYLWEFYRRRFLRILPALLVVLSVSFLVSAMFMPQFWLSGLINHIGLAAFFGLSNFVLAGNTETYFSPSADLNPYLHTWSLGVEEQFYLVFPAIYFAWLRYKDRFTLARYVLPLCILISLGISACQTYFDPPSAFYLLPSRFWELAAGAMLFQTIGTRRLLPRNTTLMRLLLPGGLALVMVGFFFAGREHFPFPWALPTVVGTLLMITAVVLQNEGAPSLLLRAMQSPWLVYVGRLSYSLYLWHWPVLVFLRWTTGLELLVVQLTYPVLVIALAAASYHWIETPIRVGKSLQQNHAWATVTFSLMAVGMLWWAALWVSNNPYHLSLSQTRDTYEWHAYKHYPREEISKIEDPLIEGRQLFVVGDSHAAAYRTMLNIVRLKLGIQVLESEQGGCGVVTLIGPDPAHCAERREANFKEIEARAKPGDIVFLASLRMPELKGKDWSRGENAVLDDIFSAQTLESNALAKASAKAVLDRLSAIKVQVIIDAPKPLFKAPANRCSDWFNKKNPVCSPGLTIDRATIERLRDPQMKLLDVLKREYPELTVWDPIPLLCPGQICSAFDNEKPLFFDSDHLSGHGNRVLTASFTQVLLMIWGNPQPNTQ